MKRLGLVLFTLALDARAEIRLDTIKLPQGFRISVYSDAVPGARSMAMGPGGTLFVGSRDAGNVYALVDAGDGTRAGQVFTLAKNLNEPNGVAVKDGALYVMEISRLLRFDAIEKRLGNPPPAAVVTEAFPKDPHHGWKFIAFGPDGLLYVPIGAPCNICRRSDPYASITRLKADGSGSEIVARGVRNTVGFDWHPETKELWFTDNGRDYLGDDKPADELNRTPRKGLNFGFPYCHGGDVSDPEFGKEFPCRDFVPPELKLGAHVAALGMRFYRGQMFPAEYQGQIFIAEHGSWNRKKKVGYRVALVRLKDGKPVSEEPFAQGWLQSEKAWGRPVDVLVRPDGSLLVSDDLAGAIYRISFGK